MELQSSEKPRAGEELFKACKNHALELSTLD